MTASTADLQALRALNLPAPRLAYLTRQLFAAPNPAGRQRILTDAENEARRNAYRVRAEEDRQYRLRREHEARVRDAAQTPSAPLTAPKRYAERYPDPKPVTTRRMEPRKPVPEVATELAPVEIQPIPEIGKAKHGSTTAYARGCRCDACREAKRLSRLSKGRARRANGEPAPHGTTTNYQRGCRCAECRKAVADYARWKRQQK